MYMYMSGLHALAHRHRHRHKHTDTHTHIHTSLVLVKLLHDFHQDIYLLQTEHYAITLFYG